MQYSELQVIAGHLERIGEMMNERMKIDSAQARLDGERDARWLIASLCTMDSDTTPAQCIASALSGILGLAGANRLEEATQRVAGLAEVLGPILLDACGRAEPEAFTESEGGEV